MSEEGVCDNRCVTEDMLPERADDDVDIVMVVDDWGSGQGADVEQEN